MPGQLPPLRLIRHFRTVIKVLLLLARIVHARFAACHLKSCAANENNQTEIVSVNKLIIKIN